MKRKLLRGTANVLGFTWLFVGIGAWWAQDWLIFPAPTDVDPADLRRMAGEIGAETLDLRAEDGTKLMGWFAEGGDRGVVVHFLGNGEALNGAWPMIQIAREHGYDCASVAYRGYPGSDGIPSAEGIELDARALWTEVERRGHRPERAVISGLSLGGGVAVGLAHEIRPAGLVLQSTFTRLSDAAWYRFPAYPVRMLLRHRIDSIDRLDGLPERTLIVHGDADNVVPVEHGRQLHAALPGSIYREIPDGFHAGYATYDLEARAHLAALLEAVAIAR